MIDSRNHQFTNPNLIFPFPFSDQYKQKLTKKNHEHNEKHYEHNFFPSTHFFLNIHMNFHTQNRIQSRKEEDRKLLVNQQAGRTQPQEAENPNQTSFLSRNTNQNQEKKKVNKPAEPDLKDSKFSVIFSLFLWLNRR